MIINQTRVLVRLAGTPYFRIKMLTIVLIQWESGFIIVSKRRQKDRGDDYGDF